MNRLDRYLARAVVEGSLLTLAVLLPLLGFFLLADEVNHVGTEHYSFMDALWFVTLSLPRYAYQIFPIATLIGALVGLGQLASGSELVAMRAAGVSIGRIVLGAMLGGVLLAAGATVVGEGIAPPAEQRALALRQMAQSGDAVAMTTAGLWARDGDTFVNIRELEPGAVLRDIHIYRVKGTTLLSATHAQSAVYEDGGWVLQNIERSLISDSGVRVQRMDKAGWSSLLRPSLLKVIVVEPQALSVWGLYRYIRYMQASGQDAGRYEVAFWGKLVQPLLILAMIFVAIPVLLGSARTTGTGVKVFAGIVIGIAFYLVSRSFAFLSLLFGMSPPLAALAPPLLFVGGALLVLRRVG
ncbi:MAG: LPS export ABC transporter permease LptG [Thiohalocapsa sp.]|uniref:LPS export ABC transporter permease LptG n=1 Tax=Thiohalocapsa sp. TaxID=2497641 RepID=UPI0025D46B72|nr:LPS export ABC transporter permease LptG [Thiohalocapsa sp.]MCG6939657.1 LPS export ABC transporter permease LptG [Thiohalocapsa sp.]